MVTIAGSIELVGDGLNQLRDNHDSSLDILTLVLWRHMHKCHPLLLSVSVQRSQGGVIEVAAEVTAWVS